MTALAKRPEMVAGAITRDVALRQLEALEEEARADIQRDINEGKMPKTPGFRAAWVSRHDERLRTLRAFRVILIGMPPNCVLLPAEWEAP